MLTWRNQHCTLQIASSVQFITTTVFLFVVKKEQHRTPSGQVVPYVFYMLVVHMWIIAFAFYHGCPSLSHPYSLQPLSASEPNLENSSLGSRGQAFLIWSQGTFSLYFVFRIISPVETHDARQRRGVCHHFLQIRLANELHTICRPKLCLNSKPSVHIIWRGEDTRL